MYLYLYRNIIRCISFFREKALPESKLFSAVTEEELLSADSKYRDNKKHSRAEVRTMEASKRR